MQTATLVAATRSPTTLSPTIANLGESMFGVFEVKSYRPPERPESVHIVNPKTGEEAWRPLFDAAGRPLFPELMAELNANQGTRHCRAHVPART
jgi:hypothetical protein